MATLSVPVTELTSCIRTRLSCNPSVLPGVTWADGPDQVFVEPSNATVSLSQGWLAVSVRLTTVLPAVGALPAKTCSDTVQVIVFLGRVGHADGLRASSTVATSNPPELAERWGPAVQTAVWEAVLDLIDARLNASGSPRIHGFFGGIDKGGQECLLVETA